MPATLRRARESRLAPCSSVMPAHGDLGPLDGGRSAWPAPRVLGERGDRAPGVERRLGVGGEALGRHAEQALARERLELLGRDSPG